MHLYAHWQSWSFELHLLYLFWWVFSLPMKILGVFVNIRSSLKLLQLDLVFSLCFSPLWSLIVVPITTYLSSYFVVYLYLCIWVLGNWCIGVFVYLSFFLLFSMGLNTFWSPLMKPICTSNVTASISKNATYLAAVLASWQMMQLMHWQRQSMSSKQMRNIWWCMP